MNKLSFLLFAVFMAEAVSAQQTGQTALPYKMEEITSPKFPKAVELAGGVCVIPIGIIEKHGPALPLGTDMFEARETAFCAAKKEYAVVFPPYYFGQIFEAKHQPGTMAYSNELMWKLLDETCRELSRNGLKKIILLNGHGGSTSFLQYFCQSQLESKRDYIVVLFQEGQNPSTEKEVKSLEKATLDQHAGEGETSMMYFINPALVDQEALKSESGLDQNRLKIPHGYTGIWWYAKFPNHFASDSNTPNKRLGELLVTGAADQVAELIKYLKADNTIEKLQEEFFSKAQNPTKK
ncbi:MAG TPA: creatininase family protein [Bacteroidales bacterium]|nr:creatininase family protein [Bacteroidales bacterium]HPT22031.1 creatininase family protein [Bacteroidales bacterium]